jgi:hypothetical protein
MSIGTIVSEASMLVKMINGRNVGDRDREDRRRPLSDAAGRAARPARCARGARLTPFAFPLMVERLREQVTTEKVSARIERMLAELERAAAE